MIEALQNRTLGGDGGGSGAKVEKLLLVVTFFLEKGGNENGAPLYIVGERGVST